MELETARDLFLFACYTGVAYCDMVTLSRAHLFTDDEGALWLKFRRQKNTLCRVKLLSEALRLIERYQSEERDTLFAPIPYSVYLAQLKALQLRAGITIPPFGTRWSPHLCDLDNFGARSTDRNGEPNVGA